MTLFIVGLGWRLMCLPLQWEHIEASVERREGVFSHGGTLSSCRGGQFLDQSHITTWWLGSGALLIVCCNEWHSKYQYSSTQDKYFQCLYWVYSLNKNTWFYHKCSHIVYIFWILVNFIVTHTFLTSYCLYVPSHSNWVGHVSEKHTLLAAPDTYHVNSFIESVRCNHPEATGLLLYNLLILLHIFCFWNHWKLLQNLCEWMTIERSLHTITPCLCMCPQRSYLTAPHKHCSPPRSPNTHAWAARPPWYIFFCTLLALCAHRTHVVQAHTFKPAAKMNECTQAAAPIYGNIRGQMRVRFARHYLGHNIMDVRNERASVRVCVRIVLINRKRTRVQWRIWPGEREDDGKIVFACITGERWLVLVGGFKKCGMSV